MGYCLKKHPRGPQFQEGRRKKGSPIYSKGRDKKSLLAYIETRITSKMKKGGKKSPQSVREEKGYLKKLGA